MCGGGFMSSLKHFVNHDMPHKPNDVHGRTDVRTQPERNTQAYSTPRQNFNGQDGSASLTNNARRRLEAMNGISLRPEMFYTQQEAAATPDGVWESRKTVNHHLHSKEEFPHG